MAQFLHQPIGQPRLGDYLQTQLKESQWTLFRAAIAFVKQTGTRHIKQELKNFAQHGQIIITTGIDQNGTTYEGLLDLFEAIEPNGEVWVFHNENQSTFHPKIYLFANELQAEIVIGSGNLTEGGLFTNYEASLVLQLNLQDSKSKELYDNIINVLDEWRNPLYGTTKCLTTELLKRLKDSGYVLKEKDLRSKQQRSKSISTKISSEEEASTLFVRAKVPQAPSFPKGRSIPSTYLAKETEEMEEDFIISDPTKQQISRFVGFVMILQTTDVGIGQVTKGTSRRSPEIFIPLAARNFAPDFWGWSNLFTSDPNNPKKMDRKGVRMRIGSEIIEVNMMTWPIKHDFRLRSEKLRSAGKVGDIMRIELVLDTSEYSYYVEIIPSNTPQYEYYKLFCTNKPRGSSQKYWGYYA